MGPKLLPTTVAPDRSDRTMQLVTPVAPLSSIATTAPQTPWSTTSPALHKGVQVGTVRINRLLGGGESVWSTEALRTGAAVGAADGYATLGAAIDAVGRLTHLTKGAAALVLREGERFYGRRAMAFTTGGWSSAEGRTRYGWHTIDERPGAVDVREVERVTADPRLAAFVDGYTT
ncbi:MAG: hypothetical protein JWN72_1270, partial [Thermoleophilia bacterium]|nr:hypothetical protein [Thermoleophilia bacterium]